MKLDQYTINMIKSDLKHKPSIDYWLNQSAKELPYGVIPMDKVEVQGRSYSMNTVNIHLAPQLKEAIKVFINDSEYGAFVLIMATVCRVLEAYTYDNAFVIGIPQLRDSAAKHHLPLGITVDLQLSVESFFKFLIGELKSIYANAHIDPRLLNERERDEAMIYPLMIYSKGLHGDIKTIEENAYVVIEGDLLDEGVIKIHYCVELYHAQTIERVKQNLLMCLGEIIHKKGSQMEDISVISQKEAEVLLVNHCMTEVNYEEITIYQQFQKCIQKNPDNVAIIFNGSEITYLEMDKLVRQYASVLTRLGARKQCCIALNMTASIDMMILIIAIIKIGAIYVPIDPNYPLERIEYMVRDSEVYLVVTERELVLKGVERKIITLPEMKGFPFEINEEDLKVSIDDSAYIIYTSGTTGVPKGVIVPHRGVLNIVTAVEGMRFKHTDRILQFASTTFDASILEIFSALLNGATLVIPEREIIKDPKLLEQFVRANNINTCILSPVYGLLLNPENMPSLTYVCFGGSVLTKELLRKWLKDHITVINAYGPTEITVLCSLERVEDFEDYRTVPIGKPIANTKIYIVGKDTRLKPYIGIGEICVATHGIAKGYINKEELTEEKFIDNPFVKGEKMYRTGDLGRWTWEGKIEYLGRNDSQVKIRGYRIELSEVEQAIQRIEGVIQVAVVVREDVSGSSQTLVAYFTADGILESDTIKSSLEKFLPSYMVPSLIVQLPQMPLNNSDKIDYKVLKNLCVGEQRKEYKSPNTEMEKELVSIWQVVLDIDKIGIRDNFFDLGGDSIKLMQVAGRLRCSFGFQMGDLFTYQTIEALAPHIHKNTDMLTRNINNLVEYLEREDSEKEIETVKKMKEKYYNQVQIFQHNGVGQIINYKNIMLTGVTGYLGIHILWELLNKTKSNIVLLIRESTHEKAIKRLEETSQFYLDNNIYNHYKSRIVVVCADLKQPQLGIFPDIYHRLAKQVDCIINSAAKVGRFGVEEDFIESNVVTVENLIEFAFTDTIKDFNQISTIAVANGDVIGKRKVIFSEDDHNVGQEYHVHYEKTKYLAEEKVIASRQKGLKANIFRMGNLVHSTKTGRHQKNIDHNNFLKLLKSTLEVGLIPQIDNFFFDFSYVDQSSEAVVRLFNREGIQNGVFHIFNPNLIDTKNIGDYATKSGREVKYISLKEYGLYLLNNLDKEYVTDIIASSGLLEITDNITWFEVLYDKTVSLLKTLNFEWKGVGTEDFEDLLSYCREVGFIIEK